MPSKVSFLRWHDSRSPAKTDKEVKLHLEQETSEGVDTCAEINYTGYLPMLGLFCTAHC